MGGVTKPEATPPNAALDQLEGLAAQTDGAAAIVENPALDPAAAPAGPDYATEAAALTDMVVAMIVGYEPKCAQFWPDERKAGVAAAAAAVMEKYNFTMGAIPPEITLLVMAGPPLYQCSRMIAEGMNKTAAKPVASVQTDAGAPDPATVTHSADMMQLEV